MDLEIIMVSEVNQRRNIVWHPLYADLKKMMQMNLFTKQKWTHSLREWTSGCPREEGGKGIVSVGLMCAAAAKSLQSCPTLCDPIDGSPPGSSIHGIFQARTLEYVAIPSFRRSALPRDQNCISSIGRHILSHWATGKPLCWLSILNIVMCTYPSQTP